MTRCCCLAAATLCCLLCGGPGAADDGGAADGNFSGSLILDVDREAADVLRAAEGELEGGQAAAGLARLQELLDRPSDVLVEKAESYVSLWEAVNNRIKTLMPAQRQAYLRLVRDQAQAGLVAAAHPFDPAALARLTDRYRHTSAGRRAAVLLAVLARDCGDGGAAAAWRGFLERHHPEFALPAGLATFEEPARPLSHGPDFSPMPERFWSRELGVADGAVRAIDGALAELNAQALSPQLTCRPLIVGQRIVTRTLMGLICVDAASGTVHWEHAIPCHAARLATDPGALNDPVRGGQVSALLLRRLIRDSLEDELSSDGQAVYLLVTPDRSTVEDPLWPANTLRALDLETGKVKWELQPPSSSRGGRRAGRPTATQARYFLGPPLVDENRLLVPAQRGQMVELVSLDPENGEVRGAIAIGQAVRDLWAREKSRLVETPPEDRERQSTACRLSRQGPFVLFPTGAGAVAWLDVTRQRLMWVHRYPRRDLTAAAPAAGDETHFREMPTRDAFVVAESWIVGRTGLVLAPDADRMLAIDLTSGRLLWSRPRGDAIQALPVPGEDSLLVIGDAGVVALGIRDGMTRWSTPTRRPLGRGIISNRQLVLPLSGGEYEFVAIDDGSRLSPQPATSGEAVLSVSLHPPHPLRPVRLRNLHHDGEMILNQSPTGLSRIHPAATSDERPSPTAERLDSPLRQAARWRYDHSEHIGELRRLDSRISLADGLLIRALEQAGVMRSLEQQVQALLISLQNAERDEDTQAAHRLRRQLAGHDLNRLYVTSPDGLHTCRLDRWLDLPGEKEAVPAAVETRPGSRPTRQRRAHWPEHAPRVSERSNNYGLSYFHNVPLLIEPNSIWGDVTVEVDRQGQVLRLHDPHHAEPAVFSLPRETGNFRLEPRFLRGWGTGDLLLLRIGAELVAFRRPGLRELPTSSLWPAEGQTLSLLGTRPPLPTSLRDHPDDPGPGWDTTSAGIQDVFGRSIADVGPVCADYLCFQQRGEIIALDMHTGNELWRRGRNPIGTRAVGDDDFVVLFHPERTDVTVLAAHDGRIVRRWNRDEQLQLPPVTPRPPFVPTQIEGTSALLSWSAGESRQLQAIDLAQGRATWRLEVPAGTIDFRFGRSVIGLAVPSEGAPVCEVRFLDRQTGKEISSLELAAPADLREVQTFVGAGSHRYLILSGRITDLPLQNVPQIHGGLHRPLVSGWLHAFDAQDASVLWSQPVENMAFPLVQPRHVPLLIVNDMIHPAGTQTPQGRLLCLDSWTGASLAELQQTTHIYFAIHADPQAARIEVRMRGKSLLLDYREATPEPP